MRLTRAALRAGTEQLLSGIETQDASNPHTDEAREHERMPLGEVNTNTTIEPDTEIIQSQKMPPKKPKAKAGAKKGAKETNAKGDEGIVEVIEVLEDQRTDAGGPESQVAVDDLAKEPTNDAVSPAVRMTRHQLAKQEKLSQSLGLRAPRSTEPVNPQFEENVATTTKQEPNVQARDEVLVQPHNGHVGEVHENIHEVPADTTHEGPAEVPKEAVMAAQAAPVEEARQATELPAASIEMHDNETMVGKSAEVITPSVEAPSEPEPKTLTSEKPCEDVTTPRRTSSRRSSQSPSKSPMRLEESFEALDALEEALENVVGAIPKVDPSGDEKSPLKKAFPRTGTPSQSPSASKVSRAANLSPKSLKSVSPNRTVRSSLARVSSIRSVSSKEGIVKKGVTEATDYLASKRRPINMSFPAPPPLQKSTRAPTKPNFQLSSDAVAAKLKAQKEERLKRVAEAGQAQPRPISMPPPPKSTKPLTKPSFQLPGEAVAAKLKAQKEERLRRGDAGQEPAPQTSNLPARRKSIKPPTVPNFQLPGEAVAAKLKAQKEERLKREANGETPVSRPISLPPPPKSTKPPTVPNFQLPGEAIAAKLKIQKEERLKREQEAETARQAQAAAAEAARRAQIPVFKARPAPSRKSVDATTVRRTASSAARLNNATTNQTIPPVHSSSTAVNKRTSLARSRTASCSTTSSNRTSMLFGVAGTGKSTVTPADAATLKIRGKEVFNRDKQEKEQREREKKEKEEAAKRARAEAAERSRIASREWAEKQKRKMMAAVGIKNSAATAVV